MPSVLVTTASFCSQDPSAREALKEAGFEVFENSLGRRLTEAEVLGLLKQHRPVGMIAGLEPLTERVLKEAAGHLRVISRCGVGTDSVDLEAAGRLGIRVFNTPGAPSQAVAELALALMLCVLRRVAEADRNLRRGEWKALQGRLLASRTVGVVGLGRIGARVAALVGAFGAEVLGCDPRQDIQMPAGVKRTNLDELLRESDLVTLHVPLNKENRHLINGWCLSAMPKGTILINTSRGGLVDEAALAEAIRSGHITGAGLDVFEQEPYQGPLRELPQVVLTSHMGSAAEECRARMEREAAENLLSHLRRNP